MTNAQNRATPLLVSGPQKLLFLAVLVLLGIAVTTPQLNDLRKTLAITVTAQRRANVSPVAVGKTTTATKKHAANTTTKETTPRIVILPGPHKTASTAIQKFLVKLHMHGVLHEYGWFWVGGKTSKGLSATARHLLIPKHWHEDNDPLKKETLA